jgi:hypothetical protein
LLRSRLHVLVGNGVDRINAVMSVRDDLVTSKVRQLREYREISLLGVDNDQFEAVRIVCGHETQNHGIEKNRLPRTRTTRYQDVWQSIIAKIEPAWPACRIDADVKRKIVDRPTFCRLEDWLKGH